MTSPSALVPRGSPGLPALGEVDARLAELRERREALMRKLRSQQAQVNACKTAEGLLDLTETRLHLNGVIADWRQLLDRATRAGTWLPLGSETPCFDDIGRGHDFRTARALVPLTPDSLIFVHGPVVLWHAAVLVEDMLEEGDRLSCLKRSAFHSELHYEPQIIAWDRASKAPIAFDRHAVAVDGVLVAASGREFAFVALPVAGHIPTRRADWHPVAAHIIAAKPPKRTEPAAFTFRLPSDCIPASPTSGRGSAALLAKLEAAITILTQHVLVGERILLLSRVLNLTIAADVASWLANAPTVSFELDWSRRRPVLGRGSLVPMRYRFEPDTISWQSSMFAYLDSHFDF